MLEINVIGNLRHTYISIIIALIVLNKHINSEEKTPAILRVTIAVIPKGHKFKVDSPDFQNCRLPDVGKSFPKHHYRQVLIIQIGRPNIFVDWLNWHF